MSDKRKHSFYEWFCCMYRIICLSCMPLGLISIFCKVVGAIPSVSWWVVLTPLFVFYGMFISAMFFQFALETLTMEVIHIDN